MGLRANLGYVKQSHAPYTCDDLICPGVFLHGLPQALLWQSERLSTSATGKVPLVQEIGTSTLRFLGVGCNHLRDPQAGNHMVCL